MMQHVKIGWVKHGYGGLGIAGGVRAKSAIGVLRRVFWESLIDLNREIMENLEDRKHFSFHLHCNCLSSWFCPQERGGGGGGDFCKWKMQCNAQQDNPCGVQRTYNTQNQMVSDFFP